MRSGLPSCPLAALQRWNTVPGHQIGVGLADPCPGVTQGDAAIQHGVQHPVAQSRLRRTLRHAFGGKQVFEDMINFSMGVLPCIICFHSEYSP